MTPGEVKRSAVRTATMAIPFVAWFVWHDEALLETIATTVFGVVLTWAVALPFDVSLERRQHAKGK